MGNTQELMIQTTIIADEVQILVERAKNHDTQAFAILYEKICKDLYRYAYYMLGNKQDAEDVVADTVFAAFETIEKLRNPASFRFWMFKILSNQCKRKLRQYVNKTLPLEEDSISWNFPDVEAAQDVKDAYARLDTNDRMIVSLTVFSGYNSKEIGKIMKMNANTVRSRLSRALTKMRGECLS